MRAEANQIRTEYSELCLLQVDLEDLPKLRGMEFRTLDQSPKSSMAYVFFFLLQKLQLDLETVENRHLLDVPIPIYYLFIF